MNEDKIQEYVNQNKDKYSRESIEQQLLGIGATKDQIDKAFEGNLHSNQKNIFSKKKNLIVISGIVLLLFLIFGYYFLIDNKLTSTDSPLEHDSDKSARDIQKILEENPNDEQDEVEEIPVPETGGEPVFETESIDSPEDEILAGKLEACEPYKGVDVINKAIFDSEVVGVEDGRCKFLQEISIADDAVLTCLFAVEQRNNMAEFIRNSSFRVNGETPVDIGIKSGDCIVPGYID